MSGLPVTIDDTQALLGGAGYVAGRGLATVVFLALKLGRPLFLEGEAGVGKTEIAKALAQALGRRLIRLQCYEGLDAASAVYEWNFPAQMVAIRTAEAEGAADRHALTEELFSERFLIRRPLLEAMQPQDGGPPVLLIDELDRTDEPFEAFLLEALSDFQVTIPELGTIQRRGAADRHPHLEPHPRGARRAEAALPLPLGRLSRLRPRARDPARARAGGDRGAVAARWWPSCSGCAPRICSRSRASPRRSTGRSASWRSTRSRCRPQVIADTLGALLKYQDDIARLQGSEAKRILDGGRGRELGAGLSPWREFADLRGCPADGKLAAQHRAFRPGAAQGRAAGRDRAGARRDPGGRGGGLHRQARLLLHAARPASSAGRSIARSSRRSSGCSGAIRSSSSR